MGTYEAWPERPTMSALSRALSTMAEDQRAALEGALDDLQALVRMLWQIGGYMTTEQQSKLRAAMARLAQHGRTVET